VIATDALNAPRRAGFDRHQTPPPSRRRTRVVNRLFRTALSFLLCSSLLHAQPVRPLDYEVKATYLFNFGRFTTWPHTGAADEGRQFSVCVLGLDPFGPALDLTMAGETIAGKPIVARRITRPAEAAGCRILFVSGSEESQLPDILRAAGGAGALTVSDLPQFAARGGMIQFVSQGNRIRFEVNLTAVEQANLILSSELLKVATAVRRTGKPGA
jgi:uncharacterized protein DUF4154